MTRLRAAATTEPGRLRTLGAALAAALVLFGAVTAWQVTDRATAADAVVDRSQPLSAAAADLYRSLADADTTAARGFLPGGKEPRSIRLRYEKDIATASALLAEAAASTGTSQQEHTRIAALNKQLPVYTGLVEQARANNRQGLPLGGAYLRHASERMEKELLPTARALYDAETDRLGSDYRGAKSWPWAALTIGLLTLGALGWAQRRTYLRTNRVFNHGLLAATAASGVVLLWLAVGHGIARANLDDSYEHGARSLQVLNTARISSLQARGAETLTMVSRHDVLTDQGKDAYEERYGANMRDLFGDGTADARPGSLLDRARSLADGALGRDPVAKAVAEVKEWQRRHAAARAADDAGDYEGALARVTGEKGSTGEAFDQVDTALRRALDHEQDDFRSAADDGRSALTGLAVGAAVLALLGAAGAVLGIGRRLSEYR
ncbi:hypothetical protein I5Q34_01905 [Streptomyces sp. AV19]|uniref:hypothetical protein n=1 Tax=Streptomyces sp. AV19 TaxID=2793068 RepID=UPI0018FF01DF|nr:hypothetical protein [Streptomyces sp. AV19]MBH1933055.1 hypothetical protein [Streptomyces sp. AV19]MDG4531767.1 hypothetical protein [Streptomyces sp. AV19]